MRIFLTSVLLLCATYASSQKTDTLSILFDSDRHELSGFYKQKIDSFINDRFDFLILQGNTDNINTESYNSNLSKKRVNSVFNYLSIKQTNTAIISINYFGKLEPKFPNNTAENRRRNRRVEIIKLKSVSLSNEKPSHLELGIHLNQKEKNLSFYDILKDILIPFLSPLLAALTFLLFLWQERKRATLQSKHQLDSGANAVLRDAILFREAYQLFGLSLHPTNMITSQHIRQLKELYSKLHLSLTLNPDVFHSYIKGRNPATSKNNLPLLMIELQRKVNSITTASNIDSFILFGIYTFLYLFETDVNLIKENKQIREKIRITNPILYDAFMVNREDGK